MVATSLPARRSGAMRSLTLTGLKWLYIVHRWLGIATCILCGLWFVSGVVMVYVPYPAFTDRDRMTYSEPVALDRVAIAPDQALAAAGAKAFPTQMKLTTLRGEPVWRLLDGTRRIAISAVDGRRIGKASATDAAEAVRRVLPGKALGPITPHFNDQWTVAPGFNPHRPLYRVPVEGAGGLTLYVSSRTGEIVQDTTAVERAWNYAGSIPHWLYLVVVRQDSEFWRQLILWTSGPALVGAATGIWLGILKMRVKRGLPLAKISPYRGWMQWHHISGLIGALVTITWLFSGWLSVNPFHWFTRAPTPPAALARYAGHAQPTFRLDLAVLKRIPAADAREIRLIWVGGRPLVVPMGPSLAETAYAADTGAPVRLTTADLTAAARNLLPAAQLRSARTVSEGDTYWYSTHRTPRRVPALRVAFDDAEQSWFHIDPATGEIMGKSDRGDRLYRWLFNAFHALDFPALLRFDPSRQALIWLLSAAGLVISVSGVVIGWRRLKLKFGIRPRPPGARRPITGSAT